MLNWTAQWIDPASFVLSFNQFIIIIIDIITIVNTLSLPRSFPVFIHFYFVGLPRCGEK